MGSCSRVGRSGASQSMTPSSRTGYQSGIGTPNGSWRLMFQSPVRPLTQFS